MSSNNLRNNDDPYSDVEQLKEKVHLSSNKLVELTYNQKKYVQKIVFFNKEAKQLISQDLIAQALIYLAEAERVLEYGASCGKTIDRNMIICTLHNQACCYYKESDLVTASRYLEGVIFNLKSTLLHSLELSHASTHTLDPTSTKHNQFQYLSLEKKIDLTQYYLKFCTINSQAKNRQIALDAGKKVIQVLKTIVEQVNTENPKVMALEANNSQMQLEELKKIFKGLKLFRNQVIVEQFNNYIRLTKSYLKRWNEAKQIKKISYCLEKHINHYSISEVIEMMPKQYINDDENARMEISDTKSLVRQLLHFAMGYFTISTEYRLMAEQLYKNSEEKYKSEYYLTANIFHLLAILTLSINVYCDLLFMKQITSSYEHHYKINLLDGQGDLENLEEISKKILFQEKPQKTKHILNALEKITKEKQKHMKRSKEYDQSEYDPQNKYKQKKKEQKNIKAKRSQSKNNEISLKKLGLSKPSINQTLLNSTKNKSINKDRSMSMQRPKKRSMSKDILILEKQKKELGIKRSMNEPTNKKTSDEYQLNTKNSEAKTGRKRISSVSSVEKTKKRKPDAVSKKKNNKQILHNNYYV